VVKSDTPDDIFGSVVAKSGTPDVANINVANINLLQTLLEYSLLKIKKGHLAIQKRPFGLFCQLVGGNGQWPVKTPLNL
jgi:hypothetical protein